MSSAASVARPIRIARLSSSIPRNPGTIGPVSPSKGLAEEPEGAERSAETEFATASPGGIDLLSAAERTPRPSLAAKAGDFTQEQSLPPDQAAQSVPPDQAAETLLPGPYPGRHQRQRSAQLPPPGLPARRLAPATGRVSSTLPTVCTARAREPSQPIASSRDNKASPASASSTWAPAGTTRRSGCGRSREHYPECLGT